MQVSDIHIQGGVAERAKKGSADSLVHGKVKAEKAETSKIAAAQVSISAGAEKGSSAEALVKARANALPEVREEKVVAAKERAASGYYNTTEFNNELAGILTVG